MQDIVIKRNMISTPFQIALNGTEWRQILGQDKNRFAFALFPGNDTIFISTYEGPLTQKMYWTAQASNSPFFLSMDHVGSMVCRPWFAVGTGAITIGVIDTVLNEDALSTLSEWEKRIWQQIMGH